MRLPVRTIRDEGLRPFSSTISPFIDDADAWDPFTEMATLRRTVNSILDTALQPVGTGTRAIGWLPPVDLYEKDGQYHIECALPGLKKEDVDIEVSQNQLTLSARREDLKIDDKAKYYHREVRRGTFLRTITFPTDIDADRVVANFDNGILKISVPSLKPIGTKKIPVKG